MEIITGYRGEPHITSAQDRATNQGCFGEGSYILDVGSKLEPEIISANEIRINDGVLSHQGCVANIALGTYDSLTISNGSQGMKRADLIVARYTRDSETLVENVELVVIEGTPSSGTPTLPSYNEGDIQAGDSPVDMPLYVVNIDGVNIDSVDLLAPIIKCQAICSDLLTDFFVQKTYTYQYTINGNGYLTISGSDLGTQHPEGYTPICIRTINTGNPYVTLRQYIVYNLGANGVLYLNNLSASNQNGTITLRVIYIKSSLIKVIS